MVHPSLDTMEIMEALFVSITSVGGSNMSSDQKGVSSSGNSGLGHHPPSRASASRISMSMAHHHAHAVAAHAHQLH